MILSEAFNSFHLLLKKKVSMVSTIGYSLPFSPLRGIVWFLLEKRFISLLDIGCGKGPIAWIIRARSKDNKFLVGIDLFLPYVKHCKRMGFYDDCILGDATYLPFKENAFDVVLAIDVVEHLSKADGLRFLNNTEGIALRQLVITTPIGPSMQLSSAFAETDLQRHKSLWYPQDFSKRKFKVRGTIGPRFFPQDIAYWLSFFIPLTYFVPAAGYHMICTKQKQAE
jgi:SAM-dependent methyltransferase